MAEELGIDTNTVCRWARDYRRRNNLPSYAESRLQSQKKNVEETSLAAKLKEAERKLKQQEKLLAEEREKVEILKKSLHIFMQAQE